MPIDTMPKQLFNHCAESLTLTAHNGKSPLNRPRDNSTYNYIVVVAQAEPQQVFLWKNKQLKAYIGITDKPPTRSRSQRQTQRTLRLFTMWTKSEVSTLKASKLMQNSKFSFRIYMDFRCRATAIFLTHAYRLRNEGQIHSSQENHTHA